MQINVKQFLDEAGITEPFYPGKRLVQQYRQEGEYKSHCVVMDWRNPEKIRIEVKAGLSGKDLEPKKLKYYPVSFQSPTFVEIELVNDNEIERETDEREDEESQSSSGSGSSDSRGLKKVGLDDMKDVAASAFGNVIEGAVPEIGKIIEMVVAGTQIAAEAFGNVMGELAKQMEHAKVSATSLLAKAGDLVTKYEPPSFLAPKGDETAKYEYDREKNADIGFRQTLG